MDIASSRPMALSMGYKHYYGNECNHCSTSIKRVKKYDCLECHKRSALGAVKKYLKTPQGLAMKKTDRRLRKVGQKQALVSWADMEKIAELYSKGKLLGMDVDHIIPLKHPLVCGLHVEDNLQLLSPEENNKKRNKFELMSL